MTLSRIKATGRGGVRYVLAIEGVRHVFCSDAQDASYATKGPLDSVSRQIYPGMRTKDWAFTERVDLVQAKLEAEAITVKIADFDAKYDDGTGKILRYKTATSVFGNTPQHTTYLSADITDSDTQVPVLSTDGFDDVSSAGTVHLGTEAVLYSDLDATDFGDAVPVTRGAWRSYATYHYVYDGESPASGSGFTPVTDRPVHFEGRRVEIFAYDAGEAIDIALHDPSTGDTPLWIGFVTAEPTFDGAEWSFSIDPITVRLKQKLGSQLGESCSIRGIYYPAAAPFTLRITEFGGTTRSTSLPTGTMAFAMAGFWETQDDFVAALNTVLAAQLALTPDSGTITQTDVTARVIGDSWTLTYRTDGASPRWMDFRGFGPGGALSLVDGIVNPDLVESTSAAGFFSIVAASTRYQVMIGGQPGLTGQGTVPRAIYAGAGIDPGYRAQLDALANARKVDIDDSTFPRTRIYLGGSSPLSTIRTNATVQWEANGTGSELHSIGAADLFAADTSARWIELGAGSINTLIATSSNPPEIRLGLSLGTGTLSDLLGVLMSLAIQYGPLGASPMLRTGEVSSGDLVAAAADSPLTLSRQWRLSSSHDLEEIVSQECRLLGAFPCIGGSGEITFKRLRFAIEGERSSATFTEADFIVDGGKIVRAERAPYGLVNLWTLKTGYNPETDEHEGTPVHVIDVEARANAGKVREIVIAPFSVCSNRDAEGDIAEAQRLASKMLGVLGGPYQTLTFRSPLSRMTTRVGSVIRITHPRITDGRGGFGLSEKACYVIAKTVKPRAAYVEFTVLMTLARVGGYAPSFRIDTISGTTGGTGPFTLTPASGYLQSGATCADYWAVGDLIRVFKWNNATPATQTGTVVSAGATLVINTDAGWTRGTDTWVVGSQVSTSVSSAQQKLYAYIGSSTGRVAFADESLDAYTFA